MVGWSPCFIAVRAVGEPSHAVVSEGSAMRSAATHSRSYAAELPCSGSLDAAAPSLAWMEGRREIERALRGSGTKSVLLGYGVRSPVGPQRTCYREQLHWLTDLLISSGHAPWTYGDRPSHPSRWQRIAHRYRPGSSVYDLAPDLLRQHETRNLSLGASRVAVQPPGA